MVFDGVRTHHFRAENQSAAELADQILIHLDAPDQLLDLFAGLKAVAVADDLVGELRARSVPREKLRTAARFVAENATHREPAKLGIVMLGVSGDQRDAELLQLLGTLDEFALFAVVALMNTQPDRQRAVFELAQRLDGWGRIHAVERLKGCSDPDIKAWLLRSGFRNGVMNEYLAHLAATTGGLYEALLEDEVDDALLDGAADILQALANGGPTEDMSDYDDALPVMHRFAALIADAAPTLTRLDAALSIESLCHRQGFEWPKGEPERLQARYETLLEQQRWRDLVLRELVTETPEGPYTFNVALSCGGQLGMDLFPQALSRLRTDPHNAYIWQWVLRRADETTIEQITMLAETLLHLDDSASGPAESLGFGPGFAADRALETVVRHLDKFPGVGSPLLAVALTSRVTRCRRVAFGILQAWPPEHRPAETHAWITAAAEREPNPELRQDLLAFLTD
ncbi:hypothetical protein [Nocardia sp. NPDC051832]|uniref:hypothetical protein n=1 Tax=Nocardia sp. NPDC051832 TaxID=3155673 RepID=UPI003425C3B8